MIKKKKKKKKRPICAVGKTLLNIIKSIIEITRGEGGAPVFKSGCHARVQKYRKKKQPFSWRGTYHMGSVYGDKNSKNKKMGMFFKADKNYTVRICFLLTMNTGLRECIHMSLPRYNNALILA